MTTSDVQGEMVTRPRVDRHMTGPDLVGAELTVLPAAGHLLPMIHWAEILGAAVA